MMPIPDRFDALEADKVMSAWFEEFETASLDTALRSVAPEINRGFADNFSAQVSASGASWPPRKDKLPHPLLILSGAMKRAVSEDGAAGHVENIGRRAMEVGIDSDVIKYAAAQNFGYAKRNLPAREYVFASDATIEKIDEKLSDAIFTILIGA